MLSWFKLRDVTEAGSALADQFPQPPAPGVSGRQRRRAHDQALVKFFQRAVHDPRITGLNFIKRAWFANTFKWRLLEKGVDAETANELTQTLVLEISSKRTRTAVSEPPVAPVSQPAVGKARNLSTLADEAYARGAYAEAVTHLEQVVAVRPRDATTLNGLGAALVKVGRYREAEECFRKAIRRRSDCTEAHGNLGAVYLAKGRFLEAEGSLRRALKSKPAEVTYRSDLGMALLNTGRLEDAKQQFERVLRVAPHCIEALLGKARIAALEGRFDQAEFLFNRALEVNPSSPEALAALAGLRPMTSADTAWLERAEKIVTSGLAPEQEASLRYAMGKYCNDIREYERAFGNYKRANELRKSLADEYHPEAITGFVDDVIRVYTRESLAGVAGGSTSAKPVFVVGMMRSGTSLVEQIIASHPQAAGAGELSFWNHVVRKHEPVIRAEVLGESLRKELAESYLQVLGPHSDNATRIVDKAPVNSDYLGIIYSVFPNARFIYMQRDPIDTCLSCYFQPLSPTLSYTMDLADLAHRYRQHRRLIAHWRTVLPPGALLEVPYADLVSDQAGWTRKILDFLGLGWDPRCLDFHRTPRPVLTASYWQVRQPIYNDSVARWRHYRKFIGPLLDLAE